MHIFMHIYGCVWPFELKIRAVILTAGVQETPGPRESGLCRKAAVNKERLIGSGRRRVVIWKSNPSRSSSERDLFLIQSRTLGGF